MHALTCSPQEVYYETQKVTWIVLAYHHSHFLAATLGFMYFFAITFFRAAHFFYSWDILDNIVTPEIGNWIWDNKKWNFLTAEHYSLNGWLHQTTSHCCWVKIQWPNTLWLEKESYSLSKVSHLTDSNFPRLTSYYFLKLQRYSV